MVKYHGEDMHGMNPQDPFFSQTHTPGSVDTDTNKLDDLDDKLGEMETAAGEAISTHAVGGQWRHAYELDIELRTIAKIRYLITRLRQR